MVTDKSVYLNNFNYPKQIPLNNEYIKPQIKIITEIPNINYSISLLPLHIKTIIDICYNSTGDISYNLKINFEIIKTKNITSPYYGKILINNDFININGYVLGENTNFFIKNGNYVEEHNYFNDASKIFLSLGNGITGITQKNINNLIKFQKKKFI